MSDPVRIQRKRTKGWRMPANTVSVTRPGRWGNPYKIGEPIPGDPFTKMDAAGAVRCLELYMPQYTREAARQELRGKNLACWCALDQPCHADVLLKIANAPVCEAVMP